MRVVDGADPYKIKPQYSQNKKCAFHSVSVGIRPTPATHLYAGVQTMRARICSASSCDMFARVVWLKSWGAAKLPTFDLSFAARTRHARLVRLTRARGGSFLRGRKALLNDFWYFSSLKSTIREKLLYDSSQANNVRPYHNGSSGN